MFQPIELARYNGQPSQMPRPGMPGQMPQSAPPAQYPMEGQPAQFPQEGRPALSMQTPEYNYIGDPIVDKYIHTFIGNVG